jgi:hypothetical protein
MTSEKDIQPKRDAFDCLAILRAILLLTEDILNELKVNSDFRDPEFAKANMELRKVVDKRLKAAIKKESPETQVTYWELAQNMVKSLNQSAQLQFMDDVKKGQAKEGNWYSVEYKGAKCYAQWHDGCYWLPRNPIGLKEADIKVLGEMVQ